MNLYHLLQQRAADNRPIRIGVIGAGKFSTMFLSQARLTPGMQIVGIAELDIQKARAACIRAGWPAETVSIETTSAGINDAVRHHKSALTENSQALIDADLDVIVEITGLPEAGARHACSSLAAGKHVVMVNVEADCMLGPAIRRKAEAAGRVYSMAYGDQPALIAEQVDWARGVGMEVVCAGKGTRYQPAFHYSTPDTVWGYYGFSEEQVASGDYNAQMFNSFLDGTKSAIEMCAVANACNLTPQAGGLQFPPVAVKALPEILKPKSQGGILEQDGTVEVVASENRDGSAVRGDLRWGVYVVFKAPTPYVRRCFAEYGLCTDSSGEYAALYRPYHLIGLELGISVASAVLRGEPTGSAEDFNADVAAVAKKDLKPGDLLDGEGGYTVFGKLVRAEESLKGAYLPMGLSGNAKIVKAAAKDSILSYDHVELDRNLFSYKLRKSLEETFKQK